MKRKFAALMSVILLAGSLAGCGGGQKAPAQPVQESGIV